MTRIAIASLWYGPSRYACAIHLWCQSARVLERMINSSSVRVDVVIISSKNRTDDCEGARHIWPAEIAEAIQPYVRSHQHLTFVRTMSEVLLKLSVFSWTEYELVIFADLDVDVHSSWESRSECGQRMWEHSTRSFLQSSAYVSTSPDHSSPVNTAVFLAKPRRWLHSYIQDVLHAGLRFNRTHGFNGAGPPDTYFRGVNISRLAQGLGTSLDHAEKVLRHRNMLEKTNDWNFVCAPVDQGMFWWLFYVQRDYGTWASHGPGWPAMDHYWGPHKPWRPNGADGQYFKASSRYLWRLYDEQRPQTACRRELLNLRAHLVASNKYAARSRHPKAGLGIVDRRSWLPAYRLEARENNASVRVSGASHNRTQGCVT